MRLFAFLCCALALVASVPVVATRADQDDVATRAQHPLAALLSSSRSVLHSVLRSRPALNDATRKLDALPLWSGLTSATAPVADATGAATASQVCFFKESPSTCQAPLNTFLLSSGGFLDNVCYTVPSSDSIRSLRVVSARNQISFYGDAKCSPSALNLTAGGGRPGSCFNVHVPGTYGPSLNVSLACFPLTSVIRFSIFAWANCTTPKGSEHDTDYVIDTYVPAGVCLPEGTPDASGLSNYLVALRNTMTVAMAGVAPAVVTGASLFETLAVRQCNVPLIAATYQWQSWSLGQHIPPLMPFNKCLRNSAGVGLLGGSLMVVG